MTHRPTLTLALVVGLAGTGCALESDAPLDVSNPDPVAMASTTKVPSIALPPLDRRAPAQLETATFALGWFWGPDSRFGSLDGVVSTRVGYAGGTTEAPTYRSMADHTETIQIDFDPEVISYRELLDLFWASHNPCARAWSRQYMSAIFVSGEAQREAAEESARWVGAERGQDVTTVVMPLEEFHLAEAYHQKYSLRRLGLVTDEFEALYPDIGAFVRSTAVTRANGVAAGNIGRAGYAAIADELGLSGAARAELDGRVR